MSWENSEDGKDYSAFGAPIVFTAAAELGAPAHLLDIHLTAEGTPGTITVKTNAGNARTFKIYRSGPFVMNITELTSVTGIDWVRAQAPFGKKV